MNEIIGNAHFYKNLFSIGREIEKSDRKKNKKNRNTKRIRKYLLKKEEILEM